MREIDARSSDIDELLPALERFHASVGKITRSSNNPFFKSKYANYNDIMEEITPHLRNNNLVVVQAGESVESDGGARPYLTTTIYHVPSGQYLSGSFPLVVSKGDAQAMGSAITYMRRYSISSLLCLCTEEDDDGNAAVGNVPQSSGPLTFDK